MALLETLVQAPKMGDPEPSNSPLIGAVVIRRRDQRQCSFNFQKHKSLYLGLPLLPDRVHPAASKKAHDFLKALTLRNHFALALEPVSLARKRIDNVDLHRCILSEVRDSSGRANIDKNQVIVIPNGNRALWRKIRCTVLANRGNEGQPLLRYHPLHIGSQLDKHSSP